MGSITARWLAAHSSDEIWRTGRRKLADADYIACDLTDPDEVRSLAAVRPSRVFHLAGAASGEYEADYAINVLAARNLIEALIAEGVKATVVLIGSAAEYGMVTADENPIREDHALRPVSVYGKTKALQTELGIKYGTSGRMRVVVARMFNVIAPGLPERLFVGSVERQIKAVLRGESQEIIVGNLEARRDYVGMGEAMEQLVAIAERGVSGEVYHVGSGTSTTMGALLDRMLSEAGLDRSAVRINPTAPRPEHDVPVIYADMSKTRALMSADNR